MSPSRELSEIDGFTDQEVISKGDQEHYQQRISRKEEKL